MEETISRLTRWSIIAVSLCITVIAVYILFSFNTSSVKQGQDAQAQKKTVQIGGNFTLTDQNGKIFGSQQLKGKLSLIYFGFTYCPDVCPESLQKLTKVLDTLDKYNIDVNALFITIDPLRDIAEVLKEYMTHFHPKIIGLTGSEEQIKEVAEKFKVYYARSKGANNSADSYMVDHTTFIYLMDKNGKYIKHFYADSKPEEIVEYVRINKK